MTKCVLVPLDGSDKDERALLAAAAVARLSRGDIRLIRVFDPPTDSMTPRMLTMGGLDLAQTRLTEASRTLTEAAAQLSATTGKEVSAEIVEGFDVATVLVARAGRNDIAMVVMATRAAGGADRALCGSVADRVMRESSKAVLLVPPGVARSEGAMRMQRVLVPLDGSQPAVAALEQLFALDWTRELEYTLLEVVWAPENASGAVAAAAERLRASGARAVQNRVVTDTNPAAAITRVTRTGEFDFVAMSPRGLSGVKRFVLGSVTQGVIRDVEVPVFLLASGDPG